MNFSYSDYRFFERLLRKVLFNQGQMMGTLDDLVTRVGEVKGAVAKIQPAVDNFERRITELLKGKLTPADQAKLDAALDDLTGVVKTAEDAASDAADETDEGATFGGSHTDRAAFDAALGKYTGGQAVNLDGTEVKAGTAPALEYYTHGDQGGAIDTTGPTS